MPFLCILLGIFFKLSNATMFRRLHFSHRAHAKCKPDKEAVIEAGLNVLQRCSIREVSSHAEALSTTVHLSGATVKEWSVINFANQTAKERMHAFLKIATQSTSTGECKERPKTLALRRRNAFSEEEDLEVDGLLYILSKYNQLVHLQICFNSASPPY